MGATGTVTYVDGSNVYAFGHPFLNLGPTQFAMTRAHVYTVLPSLDSSLKIASLGPVIGTISQDRATAIGGTIGAPPRELAVTITLVGNRGPDRKFTFYVLHDQMLTPLFSYVAMLNALTSYERQAGVMSIGATGSVSFGDDGKVEIDDAFTGEGALSMAATTLTAPIGAAITNEFQQRNARQARPHAPRLRRAAELDDRSRLARHDQAALRRDALGASPAARLPRRHGSHLDARRHAHAGDRSADPARERRAVADDARAARSAARQAGVAGTRSSRR